MGAQLSLTGVRQIRGGREALRVDSLDVGPGEHLSVLGPNGAGKTTLLRLLSGVDSPHSGNVTVDGISTARGGVELRRRVAYATQHPGLLSTSVRRNVELPLRWRKVPRKLRGELALAALERLHVAHLADEALRLADRVVVLVGGRVHQVGSPEFLNRRPADASVAALVGYDNLVDAFVEPDGTVLVALSLIHIS